MGKVWWQNTKWQATLTVLISSRISCYSGICSNLDPVTTLSNMHYIDIKNTVKTLKTK